MRTIRWMGLPVAALLAAAPLGAQVAPGSTLVFTGIADATDLGTPGVLLDFSGHVMADPWANTGSFAGLNRPGPQGLTGNITNILVGHGPQRITSFLRIGGYKFDLAFVPSGTEGQDDCYVEPVIGQRCTPYQGAIGDPSQNVGLSPFYLVNNASGDPDAPFTSIAAFNVVGTVTGPGRLSSSFFGTIASTFVGQSYQEALFYLEQYGLSGVTFKGTFVAGTPSSVGVSAAPEPATYLLLATGLGVIALVARRRDRRRPAPARR